VSDQEQYSAGGDSADSPQQAVPPEPDVTATAETPATPTEPTKTVASGDEVDLDAIEQDLTDTEVALSRLADGTYWTDEVTGQPLSDEVLSANPTARRA